MTKDGFIYIHIPTCQITYIDHVPHVVLCTYKFDNMTYKHGFRWIIQHGTSYQVTKDINCQTYEIVNLKYQARNVEWFAYLKIYLFRFCVTVQTQIHLPIIR